MKTTESDLLVWLLLAVAAAWIVGFALGIHLAYRECQQMAAWAWKQS